MNDGTDIGASNSMGPYLPESLDTSFQTLEVEPLYEGTDTLTTFLVPVLSRTTEYDRLSGYFRASVLSEAAEGVARFLANGGRMRLICGIDLPSPDCQALLGQAETPGHIIERLIGNLVTANDVERHRLGVLAWLVREGRLDVMLAAAVGKDGVPLKPEQSRTYFHAKIGVFVDAHGNRIAMLGSNNESASGYAGNYEAFTVSRSWLAEEAGVQRIATMFLDRWSGETADFKVIPLPEAVAAELVRYVPSERPSRDVGEPEEEAAPSDLATLLSVMPRLPEGERTLAATVGVTLHPHQDKVVARLAGQYPRSWLVADEVGLGKTISSGMALRRLVLGERVRRALILAPANVCIQWQDEMFEKFGLWIPRLVGDSVQGAHPDEVRKLGAGENPYETEPILLVSSHLARYRRHQSMILAAPKLDLLVVDEAHHGRRRGADHDEYRPTLLLGLLDRLKEADHTRATWLLTATPMQVDPIELFDLLRQVGLSADARSGFGRFQRWFRELAKTDDSKTDWDFLASEIAKVREPVDAADEVVLARIEAKRGAADRARIERFGTAGVNGKDAVQQLSTGSIDELRAWLRQRSPVGRYVTRHTRQTLRQYRAQGLLKDPIADRNPQPATIVFDDEERELYEQLDDLIDRLMTAHGTRKGAGFVLTTYRRRLTSSWAAIEASFRKRLEAEDPIATLAIDEGEDYLDTLDEAETDDDEGTVNEEEAVPLTAEERTQMAGFLARLGSVNDSKFDQLRKDLDAARGGGEAVIVFTQFTTTMRYLHERLEAGYRKEMATYSGGGGRIWRDGDWRRCSKNELVDSLRNGTVSVLLATDAASEGLNLQAASYLINYDLPWNPMRVEQRIGRIDRIGQQRAQVTIRNYLIPGTVEENVYRALAGRIDSFAGYVGPLQPILGATEGAFKRIFAAPKSERDETRKKALADLDAKADQLAEEGVAFLDEDPMPLPDEGDPGIDHAELVRELQALEVDLSEPGRPTTGKPGRVSRDPQDWRALITYGHPRLLPALDKIRRAAPPSPALVVVDEDGLAAVYRADHVPPTPVRRIAELRGLGPAGAAGDAHHLARATVAEQRAIYDATDRALASRKAASDEDAVLRQLVEIARSAIQARMTLLHRSAGEAPSSRLIWLELTSSARTGWCQLAEFAKLVGLPADSFLPDAIRQDGRPDSFLIGELRRSDEALYDLMARYLQMR